MKETKTAVVILNWNGEKFLREFLPGVVHSLPENTEIVVADNASTDKSLLYCRSNFPQIRIIETGDNLGYTGGYNTALQQISAQYFVLLNSDIQVTPGWIEAIIEVMDSNENIACCQPKIRSLKEPDKFEYAGASGGFIDRYGYPFCRGRIFDELEKDRGQYDDPVNVFWATGACLFVRSKAFFQVGGLDEKFFAHMEEIDLCWRLKKMGYLVKCIPQSVVYHVGGGTLPKNNPRKTFLNFRNNYYLLIQNMPGTVLAKIIFIRFLLDQLAAWMFLVKGQFHDFLAVYKAIFAVIPQLRKIRLEMSLSDDIQVGSVYKRSIVWKYFAGKIKTFSQLKKDDFSFFIYKKDD